MIRNVTLALAVAALSLAPLAQGSAQAQTPGNNFNIQTLQPIPGVWVRGDSASAVTTLSANAQGTELRVNSGRVNVQVGHAAPQVNIQVDLPGGQVSLLRDGLYTFNAQTGVVTVVNGEAEAYLGNDPNARPIKLKEDHQLALTAGAKLTERDRPELLADVLPAPAPIERRYAEGPYGPPVVYPYPYPYYAYGWGYPYFGYGYPFGFGVGFSYYGGFGGYRGGFRGFRR